MYRRRGSRRGMTSSAAVVVHSHPAYAAASWGWCRDLELPPAEDQLDRVLLGHRGRRSVRVHPIGPGAPRDIVDGAHLDGPRVAELLESLARFVDAQAGHSLEVDFEQASGVLVARGDADLDHRVAA